MKRKVGIVSCYFIHNYGSMLQAYATQHIMECIGIDNETICVDGFIREFRKKQYSYIIKSGFKSGLLRDRLGKAKNIIIKKIVKNEYTRNIAIRDKKFDEFAKNVINKSEMYNSIENLNDECSRKYDTILIGSDQLWLPANIAAEYYTLNWVPEEINTISLATSFGVSELPLDIRMQAQKFLGEIKHLSVREQAGQKIIEELTGRRIPVICDPTLFLSASDWDNIQDQSPIIDDEYVFCYFIGNEDKHRMFAKRLADYMGIKIVALTHVDHYMKCDENYADYTPYDVGPSEFLNLIKNAKYVCTDSFHSTVFSIIYQKEFFEFRRYTNDSKQSTNSRIETLFNLLNIKDRLLLGDEKIEDVIQRRLNYTSISEKLNKIKENGFKYIQDAMSDRRTDL